MTMVLFLWPMGVRNAQDAATATAIRNESGLASRRVAISMAIGAAISAVATLLKTSERVMVRSIRTVGTAAVGQPAVQSTIVLATRVVPPLSSKAVPIGIIEPRRTITGHSTEL